MPDPTVYRDILPARSTINPPMSGNPVATLADLPAPVPPAPADTFLSIDADPVAVNLPPSAGAQGEKRTFHFQGAGVLTLTPFAGDMTESVIMPGNYTNAPRNIARADLTPIVAGFYFGALTFRCEGNIWYLVSLTFGTNPPPP